MSGRLAGKGADLKPMLAKPAKATVEESFSGSTLGKTWNVAKGDWQVHDGTLVGKEKKEDNHAAVCGLVVPNHNSIIRFSFKFDGTNNLSLSYNRSPVVFNINLNYRGRQKGTVIGALRSP